MAALAYQELNQPRQAMQIARYLHKLALKSRNVLLVHLAEAFDDWRHPDFS